VRFAVFANQPGRVPTHSKRGTEKIFDLPAPAGLVGPQLALGESAQKTAARLPVGTRLGIEPVEQVVGH
jgi:hypothetical protein